MEKFFISDITVSKYPGPRNWLRRSLPKAFSAVIPVPPVAPRNSSPLKHGVVGLVHCRGYKDVLPTVGVMTPPVKLDRVEVALRSATVNGRPVRKKNAPETTQPPSVWLR